MPSKTTIFPPIALSLMLLLGSGGTASAVATASMTQTTAPAENTPLVLQMSPVIEITDDQFFEFCQLNRDLRIERTPKIVLRITEPAL
jgi:hypothetical protein